MAKGALTMSKPAVVAISYDELDSLPREEDDDYGSMLFVLGHRGDLSLDQAKHTAEAFVNAVRRFRHLQCWLCVDGYDDDPRALPEIPEVMAYMREWAGLVRSLDLIAFDCLDPISRTLVFCAEGKLRYRSRGPGLGGDYLPV